jgi:hypothetical protein
MGPLFCVRERAGPSPAYNRVAMNRLSLHLGIVAALCFLAASGVRGEAQRQTDESDAVRAKATAEFGLPVAADTFAVSPDFNLHLFFAGDRLVRVEVAPVKKNSDSDQPVLSTMDYSALLGKIGELKPIGGTVTTGPMRFCVASNLRESCSGGYEHADIEWHQNSCSPQPCPVRDFKIKYEQWKSGRVQSKYRPPSVKIGSAKFPPAWWSVTVLARTLASAKRISAR